MRQYVHCGMAHSLSDIRLPVTTRVNLVHLEEGLDFGPTETASDISTHCMLPSDDPVGLDTGLPMLSKTRQLKLQAGTNLSTGLGFLGDDERPSWKATTDLGRPPIIQVTLRMLGPMMRNAYRIVRADVLEELECHFVPHINPYEHWPKLIDPFRRDLQLKKLTFGPTYSLAGLLLDFIPKPSLGELTFCVPEVTDWLVSLLAKCKEDQCRRGRTRLPPVVRLRLLTRIASHIQVRIQIARLQVSMARVTKIEAEYRDCSLCHRIPKSGDPVKLVWDGFAWVPRPP
ncbi:hypothetical protein GY45DRAFT_454531 [Cubamyces sp. BRFM 1775]|nr:hypothetical protein GY45DRAFT_454531 [Cubamyces sp. BRFM 1775]